MVKFSVDYNLMKHFKIPILSEKLITNDEFIIFLLYTELSRMKLPVTGRTETEHVGLQIRPFL